MSPNQRQTVLKLILPALAIGVVYVYFVARPLDQKLKDLTEQISAAAKSAPKPVAEAQLASKLKTTRQEIERLKAAQKIAVDPGRAADIDRAEYGKRLSVALAKYRLVLLGESAEPNPGPLPPGLSAPASGADPTRLEGGARSIRFTGRYVDVLAALKELDGPDHRALPLRLTMKRAEEGSKSLLWTLILWL